jgi:methyl-accepting chemotaxis protein
MATTLFRRRNYFTKKDFQTRFILPFLLASSLANILSVTLFVVLARNKIDGLLYSMRMPSHNIGALLAPAALIASLVAVITVSLSFLWVAWRRYYIIAGPLQQIRADLHRIGAGDLSPRISLRERDEFRDFAEQINAMAGALSRGFLVLKNQTGDLSKAAGDLKASPGAAEARALSKTMAGTIRSMQQQIGTFKR